MLSFIFLLKQVNLCMESLIRGGWRCSSVCVLGGEVGRIEREQVELRTCIERVTWKLIIPYVKQIANGNLLNDSGNSNRTL